jgi:hypothetical protein
MTNPHNIRALSRTLIHAGYDPRIKKNAAKRVISIRFSPEVYRQRKALIEWARKYNATEMNRLLALPSNVPYTNRIQNVQNLGTSRTNYIKSIIAKYLLNHPLMWNNARNAIARLHQLAGHQGNARMTNARLVGFLMRQSNARLRQFNHNFPFYA